MNRLAAFLEKNHRHRPEYGREKCHYFAEVRPSQNCHWNANRELHKFTDYYRNHKKPLHPFSNVISLFPDSLATEFIKAADCAIY